MFCKNCGNELNDAAIVCLKCGTATHNYNGNVNKKPKKEAKEEKDFNLYVFFKYITAITICLSVMFMLWSLCRPHVGVSDYLYLTSYYGDVRIDGSINVTWLPNFSLSIVFLVLASLGFIFSIIAFVQGFIREKREKRFITDIMFVISSVLLFMSIIFLAR